MLVTPWLSAECMPIANDTEWKDSRGEEIRAQGGSILPADGVWWWYGIDTDVKPDGTPVYRAIRCYSSNNLSLWKPHGKILTERVPARVQVARTAGGEQWVLFLRDVMPPAAIQAEDRTVRLASSKVLWPPSWWLDAAKGTWSKTKEQEP
jgi:hypothetical protein